MSAFGKFFYLSQRSITEHWPPGKNDDGLEAWNRKRNFAAASGAMMHEKIFFIHTDVKGYGNN
jgi:hypothetical protein